MIVSYTVTDMSKLRKLDLSVTHLTVHIRTKLHGLPDISHFTQMKDLYLKDTKFKTLNLGPTSITRLTVTYSDCEGLFSNQKDIPCENVCVTHSQMKLFPDFHPTLQKLTLSYSKLTDVSGVTRLKNLNYLNLRANNLTTLPNLSRLQTLMDLDISENKLTKLPKLPDSLLTLKANNNQLDKVNGLEYLRDLRFINLSSNPIVSITLPTIPHIEIKFTPMTELKLVLGSRKVELLDVRCNKLTHLPNIDYSKMRYLNALKNHLYSLPVISPSLGKKLDFNFCWNWLVDATIPEETKKWILNFAPENNFYYHRKRLGHNFLALSPKLRMIPPKGKDRTIVLNHPKYDELEECLLYQVPFDSTFDRASWKIQLAWKRFQNRKLISELYPPDLVDMIAQCV